MSQQINLTGSDLPDSLCPHCGFNVHPMLQGVVETQGQYSPLKQSRKFTSFCLVRCPRTPCHGQFYLTAEGTASTSNRQVLAVQATAVWPPPMKALDSNIDTDVSEDFKQAYACLKIGAHRAATLMIRRCVENACVTCGGEGEDLYKKIEDLKRKNKLHPTNAESAHKARILGREVAHILREVTPDEIEKCLFLVEKILEDLFVVPAIQQQIGKPTTTP